MNKSQGQTLGKCGLYLKKPCFSHGQLQIVDFIVLDLKRFEKHKERLYKIMSLSENSLPAHRLRTLVQNLLLVRGLTSEEIRKDAESMCINLGCTASVIL